MGFIEQLPKNVADVLGTASITEFGTVSAAGLPIDTPLMLIPNDDLTSLDVATGLSYPTKAERARRNPKVGLLIEGAGDGPVISVAGMAAVRDSDLQGNMERYYAETMLMPLSDPPPDYQTEIRPAVWYYARILITVAPVHIRWWESPQAMDNPPNEWRAPAGTTFPTSDPAPPGKPSESSSWAQPTWRELADIALGHGVPGYLTLLDDAGFPLPIRARDIRQTDDGFRLSIPKGAPWTGGAATLVFEGRETFVGDAQSEGGSMLLRVERALPILPMKNDPSQILQPNDDTRAQLMSRLEHEARRRGQPVPAMPARQPEPTAGAKRRIDSVMAFLAEATR